MRNNWQMRKRQFGALYRVFLMRVVDLELLSADADTTKLIGQFATVFAGLSLLFILPLVFAMPSFIVTGRGGFLSEMMWTPEHFFIATTMVVVGVLSVLTWDSAFPDRRDLLVLGPLPIRPNTLFLAKTAALFAAPGLAILSLNVFTGLLWPILFMSFNGGLLHMLRAWPAYWFTVTAAGMFLFCSALTMQGIAVNLLPRQLYLRISPVLQAGTLSLVLITFLLEPKLESTFALTSAANRRLLECLPTYWFLGIFQQINGSMVPAFSSLARRGWIGLVVSIFGAGVALLLSYLRISSKVVEQPDIVSSQRVRGRLPSFGSSLKGTIILFGLRTLLRSRQHRMILSFYFGFGVAVLMGYIERFSGPPARFASPAKVIFLVASTLLMILAMLALRVVATIPISLRANWIFRTTQIRLSGEYTTGVWAMFLALGMVPVWLVAAGFCGLFTWRLMLGHLLTLLFVGMLLAELCLLGFRKIPFACSYLPGKANIHFVFWACLIPFIVLLDQAARLESRLLGSVKGSVLMILCIAALAGGARWLNKASASSTDELLYEEEYPPVMVTLNLKSQEGRK